MSDREQTMEQSEEREATDSAGRTYVEAMEGRAMPESERAEEVKPIINPEVWKLLKEADRPEPDGECIECGGPLAKRSPFTLGPRWKCGDCGHLHSLADTREGPAHKVLDGTDDDRPEPDGDVMGELHGAFGVKPEFEGGTYRVLLRAVAFRFTPHEDSVSYSVRVQCHGRHLSAPTLPEAIDAAKEAARKLLDETREVLT